MAITAAIVSTIMKRLLEKQIVSVFAMVNANISQYERDNDVNHQYTKETRKKMGLDDNGYCVRCGHYQEVSYIREVDCECDCHD